MSRFFQFLARTIAQRTGLDRITQQKTLNKSLAQFKYVWHVLDVDIVQPYLRDSISPISGIKRVGCFGCSNTYGAYLPKEQSWPSLLQNKISSDFLVENLGISGVSTGLITRLIYSYIYKYRPAAICCLFPDSFREDNFTTSFYPPINNTDNKNSIFENDLFLYWQNSKNTEHETILQNTFFNYVKNFLLIKETCKANNVKFIWHTWCGVILNTDISVLQDNVGYDVPFILKEKKLYNISADVHRKPSDYASDGYHHGVKYNEVLSDIFARVLNQ